MAGHGYTYAPAENIQRMSLFPAYSVSDKDYRFLGRFSNLEVLCLRDIDLDKVRFEFPVLPKLVEICIDDNRVTPRVLEWLRQQPRLKRVKLWSVFSPTISIASARIGCSNLVEIDPGVRTGKVLHPTKYTHLRFIQEIA